MAAVARVGAVGEQHGNRPIALRLQAEGAAEFQRGGKPSRQRQRLADKPGHHRVVVMAGQQCVGERPQPHEPAANRALGQEERQDAARDNDIGNRRAAGIKEGWSVGHARKIGGRDLRGYRSERKMRPRPLRRRARSRGG